MAKNHSQTQKIPTQASKKSRKNLKVIIPCAGFGTRGLPAAKTFSKELFLAPFEGFIQNMLVIQLRKLQQARIPSENILIVYASGKEDLFKPFEFDQDFCNDLRAKGKGKFAEILESISNDFEKISFRLQDYPHYGNNAPILSPSSLKFIGESDFMLLMPDDLFATKGKNEIEQILEVYENYGGSVLMSKEVEDPQEFDKYGIFSGKIIARPKNGIGEIYEIDSIDEKPGFEKAKSNHASVSAVIFENSTLEDMKENAANFNGQGELMFQDAIQIGIDKGRKYYAAAITNGIYCDTGNYDDYFLSVLAMFLNDSKDLNGLTAKIEKIIKKVAEISK